jgi:hypothetical protein
MTSPFVDPGAGWPEATRAEATTLALMWAHEGHSAPGDLTGTDERCAFVATLPAGRREY